MRAWVRKVHPQVVVNAAAYTAVDRAEQEPSVAFVIHAKAPRVLAEEVDRLGSALVHFSTDYVFDRTKESAYTEDDPTGPLGVYGQSKLEGERGVQDIGGEFLILRTSWVFGTRGHNFLRTMLRLARERKEVRVVNDQRGAPTWSRMLAEATAQILAGCSRGDGFRISPERSGIYHLTGTGETTWFEFASTILSLDPDRANQRCRSVIPIRTEEYPTPAVRPRSSVLDCSRVERAFQVRLPDWREQLALALQVDDVLVKGGGSMLPLGE